MNQSSKHYFSPVTRYTSAVRLIRPEREVDRQTFRREKMKTVIRILALSALLVAGVQALASMGGPIPWNPPQFSMGGPIPWNPPAK